MRIEQIRTRTADADRGEDEEAPSNKKWQAKVEREVVRLHTSEVSKRTRVGKTGITRCEQRGELKTQELVILPLSGCPMSALRIRLPPAVLGSPLVFYTRITTANISEIHERA